MPTREVVVSVASYTNASGVRTFAERGETIDVHPDHVERFDSLNVVPGAPVADPVVVIDDSDGDEVADDTAEAEDTTPEQPEDESPAQEDDIADEPTPSAEPQADDRLDAVLDLGAPKRPARAARVKG
ncbi:MAG: hypothetical protein ACRDTI_07905 [Mycobacterium sp.]